MALKSVAGIISVLAEENEAKLSIECNEYVYVKVFWAGFPFMFEVLATIFILISRSPPWVGRKHVSPKDSSVHEYAGQ